MSTVAPTRGMVAACLLAGVLAVGWLHHEVLVGGMVYHMDDAADGYYPSHVAILRAYGDGTSPTWERGSWCGWPLAADPYYGAFYPLTLLFALLGAARGLGWQVVVHVLLAGGGMFALLRRRKLDLGPALLGAASLALGSFMTVRVRHVIFVQGIAWMPLVLYGVDGWLETRRRRELALAGFAGGMALVCGALPLALFFGLFVAAYALPRLVRVEERGRAALGLGAAAGLALLVGAAQLAPTVAHIPYSPRALGVDYAFASSYAWPKLAYLGTLVAPDLFGGEDRAAWYGAFNHWEMAGWYAGALVVLLAPLGLARARKQPELWALFGLSLLAIALAFGDATPLHKLFFNVVPTYKSLRCPTRALVMLLLGFPILAAEGAEWLAGRERERERERGRIIGLVIAVVVVVMAAVGCWIIRHPRLVLPSETVARGAFAHLCAVLGIGGATLALGLFGVLRGRTMAIGLAVITMLDLVVIGRGYVQPKEPDYPEGMERFAAVDWLHAQHPTDRFAIDPNGPFRLHNTGMVYGLESANGYDSVTVWHYVNFLYTLNHGAPYPWPTLRDDLAAGDIKNWNSPLVDLLNVRWAISTWAPAPGWVERFHPPPADKHGKYDPTWNPRLRVYENPHPLPRAFVVYRAQVLPDDGSQARALLKLDPHRDVLLDRAPPIAPVGDGRPFTPARELRLQRHRVTIDAEASAPGILVLSDTDYPGWSATVDGKPAPILRADYAFRGVAIPAGRHLVEMTHRSRPTQLGVLLSILGLIGLFGLALRGGGRPSVL